MMLRAHPPVAPQLTLPALPSPCPTQPPNPAAHRCSWTSLRPLERRTRRCDQGMHSMVAATNMPDLLCTPARDGAGLRRCRERRRAGPALSRSTAVSPALGILFTPHCAGLPFVP